MKKTLTVFSVALLVIAGSAFADFTPTYSVNIPLVNSSPNSSGVITDGASLGGDGNEFSIPMQFNGTGDWVSNNWTDGNNYVFNMDLAGGLTVLQSKTTCPVTAQWTFTGFEETTILFGSVENFVYGGPAGTSTALLRCSPTVYGMNWIDKDAGTKTDLYAETYNPGAYQGFGAPTWGHEDNALLMYPAYQLEINDATGAGTLTAVPEPATIGMILLGALGFIRRRAH